ncbi:hypothetical protein [Streptacidiphilus cavernicola]|uniref:Lipoprotein n=1 Tax=Streptacidiphilus cavernicola TaxID=3342716 RepID=A0ABV6W651_9ACTN
MNARAGRLLAAGGLLAGGMAGVVVLAGCGSSSSGSNAALSATSAFSPNPSQFSGEPPSALSSLASSAQAAVSATASSARAAASAFESSVSAASVQAQAAAKAELAKVSGAGNAVADVGLTGVNRATTGGLNAAVVTVTNRSGAKASYAVKINFEDASGKVVDSTVVAAPDLAAGAKAQPVAFSTKDTTTALIPRVAQAQRY